MGLPAVNELSGMLAVASGLVCFIVAGILRLFAKNLKKNHKKNA